MGVAALGGIPVAAALLVFWPVVHAYFFGDDFIHLIQIVNEGLGAVVWRPYMSHLYVVPTLVYAALWRTVGMRAEVFYGFVLAVHLLNVALLFAVARVLTASPRLASLGALSWGTCPLHEGTLAWFCVHGQALGTTALLVALYGLARAAHARRPPGLPAMAVGALLLFAASTCFGTVLASIVVFPLAATLATGRLLGRSQRRVLVATLVAVLALYGAVHWLYPVTLGPRPLPALQHAIAYPGPVAATMLDLLTIGLSGLVGNFVRLPGGFPSTDAVLLAVAAALLGVTGTVLAAPTRRRWIAGLSLLAVAAYGSVAVGRAEVQAVFSWTPEKLAELLRYHYAATASLALVLTLATATVAARRPMRPAAKDVVYAAAVGGWLLAFSLSTWQIDLHADTRAETARLLVAVVQQSRLQPAGSTVVMRDRRFNPTGIWNRGFTAAGLFTLFLDSDELDGRRIRYLPDPLWSPATPPPGSLLARLLTPPEVPPVTP